MRDFVDWRQADFKKLGIAFGALAVSGVFVFVSARFTPHPNLLMAAAPAGCANKKLPGYFASDARVVRALGGGSLIHVPGAPEIFGIAPAASASGVPAAAGSPAGAPPSEAASPEGSAAPYGNATIGTTTVVRPDAGTLLLAVAQNEKDRELGLMCVTKMAPRVGMIFVFGNETVENFWMKDTLIPLDMIFVSDDGRVNAVAANVPSSRIDQPDTSVARRSGRGRYVIELNAGEAAKDDIKPGVHLQIPHLLSMD